jgi:hypothetical protein
MTELETLLLQQLEQQQRDSAKLVNELSGQLDRLQKALSDQQADNAALRREIAESDRRNAQAVDALTKQFEALSARLNALGKRSSG